MHWISGPVDCVSSSTDVSSLINIKRGFDFLLTCPRSCTDCVIFTFLGDKLVYFTSYSDALEDIHVIDLGSFIKTCVPLPGESLPIKVKNNVSWKTLAGSFLHWNSIVVCQRDCYRQVDCYHHSSLCSLSFCILIGLEILLHLLLCRLQDIVQQAFFWMEAIFCW